MFRRGQVLRDGRKPLRTISQVHWGNTVWRTLRRGSPFSGIHRWISTRIQLHIQEPRMGQESDQTKATPNSKPGRPGRQANAFLLGLIHKTAAAFSVTLSEETQVVY